MHDDLAEYLPARQPFEARREIGKLDLGVDHRGQPGSHFGEAVADVAHGGAERADDPVLLLEQLHQVERRARTGGRPAGHQTSAALERQERTIEGLRPDMLEYHVDALLSRELAHRVFEP